ncbi:hypothetical protein N781_15310 [Pontibacillus halophilus JSM 076056 = DSM 19796]|uniref:Uncharacterized protein n=1 Tax=Pontibacillus halophilus JSM 076056 = DSM 19796 TaxID=1385510 RepID=A0A0A5GLA7_9BACI|nr:hypothetical protein [Pontibacillus halophilus]KGX92794.1 hypothetical protein N781_15310 [Pontibacillus halophilus JSM 076056 = DSM 19796]
MAKEERPTRDFDSFMFGGRGPSKQAETEETSEQQEKDASSFDLFETTQTVMDTYKQLSPYVKDVIGFFKKK